MEKIKCFIIEQKELLLEKILVEYDGVPIFYLCSHDEDLYIVLCTDVEKMEYIIAQPKLTEILSMLEGRTQMRKIFIKQKGFWKVKSAEDINDDIIDYHSIEDLDLTILPIEGAYFSILTSDVENYVDKLKLSFLNQYMPGLGFSSNSKSFHNKFNVKDLDLNSDYIPAVTERHDYVLHESKIKYEKIIIDKHLVNYDESLDIELEKSETISDKIKNDGFSSILEFLFSSSENSKFIHTNCSHCRDAA